MKAPYRLFQMTRLQDKPWFNSGLSQRVSMDVVQLQTRLCIQNAASSSFIKWASHFSGKELEGLEKQQMSLRLTTHWLEHGSALHSLNICNPNSINRIINWKKKKEFRSRIKILPPYAFQLHTARWGLFSGFWDPIGCLLYLFPIFLAFALQQVHS